MHYKLFYRPEPLRVGGKEQGERLQRGPGKSWVVHRFTVVMVSWVYTCVKRMKRCTLNMYHKHYVCQLYLWKAVFKNEVTKHHLLSKILSYFQEFPCLAHGSRESSLGTPMLPARAMPAQNHHDWASQRLSTCPLPAGSPAQTLTGTPVLLRRPQRV